MPFRGGPPPEFGQLGQVGGQAAPQVPGLLQMAQSAMDGGGQIGPDFRASGQAFGGDPRDTAQAGAPPAYNPGTTQGGYNAVFDPRAPSADGGWFTMGDYLKQAPTPMEAAMNPGSMLSPRENPQAGGNNFLSTNNWRLLGNDPDNFMINGNIVNRRAARGALAPKSVLGTEGTGFPGYHFMGGGQWTYPYGSQGAMQGYIGSDNWGSTSTPTS